MSLPWVKIGPIMSDDFFGLELALSFFQNLIWPALAIFQLIVALTAKQRVGTSATNLMVFGSVISMIMSVVNAGIQIGMMHFDLGYEMVTYWYSFSWLFSLTGSLLFLVGLWQLVKSVGDDETKWN